ncbi:MAG: hypothetical protein ED559_00775 [Phycisphaera sp.]|nr:MAG: hypothetical protein ED559_00775 [Phycisphaera sp.]
MACTSQLVLAAGLALSSASAASGQTLWTWDQTPHCTGNGYTQDDWGDGDNWLVGSWAGPGHRVEINSGPAAQFIWFDDGRDIACVPSPPAPPAPEELFIDTGGMLFINGEQNHPIGQPVQLPLDIAGTVENNGQITISNTVTTSGTGLTFSGAAPAITGSGTISLQALGTNRALAFISQTGGAVLTHGAGHTIQGQGAVFGDLINSGTILNENGNSLIALELHSPTVMQTATGVIRANAGGSGNAEVHLMSHTGSKLISGGRIGGQNGGLVRVKHPDTTLDTLTIDGLIVLNEGTFPITATGDIVNDGELRLTGGAGGFDGHTLRIDGDSTWSSTTGGELRLEAVQNISGRAKIVGVNPGDVLTSDPSHAIRGNGEVHVELDNQGTISADNAAFDLHLFYPTLPNSGSLLAENGGNLRMTGIAINQTGSGEVRSIGTNSDVFLGAGTTVSGGTAGGTGGGAVVAQDGSTFNTVSIDGLIEIENAGVVTTFGNTTNTGVVQFPATGSATELRLGDSATWSGSGEIVLDTFNNGLGFANIGYDSPTDVLTNAADHTIRGNGDITNAINNLGTISADKGAFWMFRLRDLDKTNSGTIEAVNASRLRIDAITINQTATGRIVGGDGGGFVSLDNGPTIIGGTVGTEGDGVFEGNDTLRPILDSVTTTGRVGVRIGRELEIRGTVTNNGEIVVHTDVPQFAITTRLHRTGPVTLTGSGRLVVNSFNSSDLVAQISYENLATDILTNAPGHRIEGRGGLHGNIINQGTIAPGSDYENTNVDTARLYMVDGGIECQATATLEIQVGGTADTLANSEFDRIIGRVGTTFECAGSLHIENINGFGGLSTGESIDIIEAPGGVTGTFDTVTLAGGASYEVEYLSDRVILKPACPADTNNDGVLTPADFTAWINAFNNDLPECDQNADGSCTPTDFTAWIANFNAGCS